MASVRPVLGKLRIGEGRARYGLRIEPDGQPEERVADHEAGLMVGRLGPVPAAGDVADGIDAAVGRLQAPVDPDAMLVVFDFGSLKPQTDHIGPASARQQEVAARDRLLAVGPLKQELVLGIAYCRPVCLRGSGRLRPGGSECPRVRPGPARLRRYSGSSSPSGWPSVRGPSPRRPAGGRPGQPPGRRPAGPDHDEALGTDGEVERGLDRQVRHRLEFRNGRQRWRRAGGNDEAAGGDLFIAGEGERAASLKRAARSTP